MKISTEELKEKNRIRQAKWKANNLEKVRQQARNYVIRKREENPEEYRLKANSIAKKSREKHLEKYKARSREYSRLRRLKDREGTNRKNVEWRKAHPDRVKIYNERRKEPNKKLSRLKLLKKYNLNLETYNQMILKQEGKCAICKCSFENKIPNIDHNHDTGKVRELLCSSCNILLGHWEKNDKRSENYYQKFVEYLKIHSK